MRENLRATLGVKLRSCSRPAGAQLRDEKVDLGRLIRHGREKDSGKLFKG
eukprot:CAMPEP_0202063478 /NCGR_PEP_ID=MMETSP0963-20130614/46563_1 /ASSEMBLY_ACC=CAM_ASM_000494 /TAXON_ID=4773 /ORGANISM="Schizochytrium aggregatum, Strain ATCC28209" /LENGTH=49 /DNA_ID=CAMNT_0048629877 /DNA_START=265 /DNA_END=414 /DNA_ORIENTATION=+